MLSFQVIMITSYFDREREAARRSENSARDLRHHGRVPPPYSILDNELTDTGGETTETSMSELEHSDQDEPISPPPAYTP